MSSRPARSRPARSRATPSAPARSRRRVLLVFAVIVILIVVAGTIIERLSKPGWGEAAEAYRSSPAVADELGTCGDGPVAAPRELRGMYLATVRNIDWPSRPGLDTATVKAEYLGWLDLAQRLNHNAIFVQVRPSGDAFWPSQYAPWSEWLTGRRDGVSPGWDPLEWMIAQTHARNLEFHAWFNPYHGSQPVLYHGPGADLFKLAPNHPLRAHPEWAVVYPVGSNASRFYYDPGIPAARSFIEDSILEAVARYDVDGVDFDDFFYPYPEAGQDFADANSFAAYGNGFASKAEWRRENINKFVREMSERVKALKPWVKFGISPFGIWRNSTTDPAGSATNGLQSYDQIYVDSRKWVKQRWVDSITPQLYWNIGFARADYAILLRWWSAMVAGTGVQLYIAHADYRIGGAGAWKDPGELDRQIAMAREYRVDGNVHFNPTSIRADLLGAVTRYRTAHYASPALVPRMARLPATVPAAPVRLNLRRGPDGVTVTWHPGEGPAATSYAIYRHDGGSATSRLVATVRSNGDAEQLYVDRDAAKSGSADYCVSGLDRSWNEGRLSQPTSLT